VELQGAAPRDQFIDVFVRADGTIVAAGKTWGSIAEGAATTPMQSLVRQVDPTRGSISWTRQWVKEDRRNVEDGRPLKTLVALSAQRARCTLVQARVSPASKSWMATALTRHASLLCWLTGPRT
jgi:hypothetical protein